MRGESSSDTSLRVRATREALRSIMVMAHPEISWSVVLGASLTDVVPIEDVSERLRVVFATRPELGFVPPVRRLDGPGSGPSLVEAALDVAANTPFGSRDPLVRVLVLDDPPRLVLAAHHAVLDGLGLLSVLGATLASRAESDVRGLPHDRSRRRGFLPTALGRLAEAVATPPTRVAPADGDPGAKGDWLLSCVRDGAPPGTSALAAAVVRAVRGWNGSRSEPADRIVLAVGASLRPGSDLQPDRRSAYLRMRADTGDASALAAAIRAAPIQTEEEPTSGLRGIELLSRPIVRLASSRMGSTALVSSLGRVSAPAIVRDIQFFPVAHGRSAVTVGMSGLGARTVVTLRCGRSRFSEAAAAALADLITAELEEPGEEMTPGGPTK